MSYVDIFERGGDVIGTIDGQHGDHILLAPPFIAGEAEPGEMVARLADAVNAALA
jgi:adenosylmethionine-8-amino-7-oxononanoate aminotransferase